MKVIFTIIFGIISIGLYGQDANQIIDNYLNKNEVDNLSGKITYKNISKSGRVQQRTLEQFVQKNNKDGGTYSFLLKFVAPGDVAGTATLTVQRQDHSDDQWLYLPVVRSARRISASKKSDRFMGTEMTYEDLSLYLAEKVEEWDYSQGDLEDIAGIECYKIIARLLKVYEASDVKDIGGSQFRAHGVVLSNKITGNRTEVSYSDFDIEEELSSSLFTKAQLESF